MLLQLLSLLLTAVLVAGRGEVELDTEYGRIRGNLVYVNTSDVYVRSFYAVPFGQPAVGNLRFAPAVEVEAWNGTRNCTEPGESCPQGGSGSEDCLHSNIVTPNDQSGAPYPVMIWWHGGAYRSGGANGYSGHWYAAKGVVAVIAQYRLGCIGWANTGDDVAKGNYGLYDQLQALRFVQKTIHSFGGDPSKVTVFGQSAGGSSAGLHLLSPLTKDLFHNAVLISGTDMAMWAYNPPWLPPENYTRQVAQHLDCPIDNTTNMISCLRQKDHEDISSFQEEVLSGYITQGFAPVVDGEGGFLPDDPFEIRYKLGFHKNVRVMGGHTTGDGSTYLLPFVPEAMDGGWNSTMHEFYIRRRMVDWVLARNPEDTREYATRGLQYYYTDWPYTEDPDRNRFKLREAVTDVGFGAGLDSTLKNHTKYNETYEYLFGYMGTSHRWLLELLGASWMDVTHGMGDLPFWWGFPLYTHNPHVTEDTEMWLVDLIPWEPIDEEYSNFVIELLVNFAKYGDPTPTPVRGPRGPVTWEKFTMDKLNYLYIHNDTVENRENLFQKNNALWEHYAPWIVFGRERANSTQFEHLGKQSVDFHLHQRFVEEMFNKAVELGREKKAAKGQKLDTGRLLSEFKRKLPAILSKLVPL